MIGSSCTANTLKTPQTVIQRRQRLDARTLVLTATADTNTNCVYGCHLNAQQHAMHKAHLFVERTHCNAQIHQKNSEASINEALDVVCPRRMGTGGPLHNEMLTALHFLCGHRRDPNSATQLLSLHCDLLKTNRQKVSNLTK